MYISLEVYLQYFPSIHVKSMNVLGTEFSPNFEFSLTEYHYYLLRHLQSTFANTEYLFNIEISVYTCTYNIGSLSF